MSYDLRVAPWIPFRRRSGAVEWLPPDAVAAIHHNDPIVALGWPRPDFNGATLEFLIGLFSVALAVRSEAAWADLAACPPAPDALRAALMALPDAFRLDGDGPRFLQDHAAADFDKQAELPIENLLIDAAGENTQKLNKDLFVKRGRIAAMGRAAAAAALLTLQSYAPSGGQGHRTSLRGGGPLTTLVDPRADGEGADAGLETPLWALIHANLLLADRTRPLPADWNSDEGRVTAARIWPWLAPTQVSRDKGSEVTPQRAHPFQALFGMPRRIRLVFRDGEGVCGLTAQADTVMVPAWRTLNFGVNYGSGLWIHPLSPHYRSKELWLPIHPQPDGLGWKDWGGLVMARDGRVAACVQRYRDDHADFLGGGGRFAVRAFGYDMDNMKARGWVEAVLPAWPAGGMGPDVADSIALAAEQMADAARIAANLLVGAVQAVQFRRREDARGDFSHLKAALWSATSEPFYRRIDAAARLKIDDPLFIVDAGPVDRVRFVDELGRETLRVFDFHADQCTLDVADAHRQVAARQGLVRAFRGQGKAGAALFNALGMPVPAKPARKSKESKA